MTKRILAVLLSIALLLGCIPLDAGAESAQPTVLTEEDYASADAVFDAIASMEAVRSTRSADQSQITDAAQALVEASDSYVEGSLERNGDAFTWMTAEGIRCTYNPRMREIYKNMTPSEASETDGIYNEPMAVRSGFPRGKQVYLVGPYYGYDSNFTDQYKNEAKRIATAIGDTDGYTLYSGKAATVDKVAEAVSTGAVVIFDSHGATDYESGYDYVTGATSSYLCLTSTTGLTGEDYDDGALYYSNGICINGATIANHMTTDSPGGILWMAICFGMATNTICDPLREKGVEVLCGYSQSVTFAGDYLFEDAFWDKMTEGQTVAQACSYMKSTLGNWDWSTKIANYFGYSDGYSSISAARSDYAAFPVVVSDEDTHPGQRKGCTFYGADSLQTVRSTYTLFGTYTAQTAEGYWTTLQEAIDNANGSVVTLLQDTEEAVTADTLYLDLNGFQVNKITVSKALYGFDSTATTEKQGSGGIIDVQGAVVPEHSVNGSRYIALEENGAYTFHKLEMSLNTATLRTGEAGLYYRGSIACDDVLRGKITLHGIALSTVDMPGIDFREAHNLYTENAGAPEGDFSSVMISGIFKENAEDNDSRGKMAVYANVYLELTDGTVLLSDNTSADTKEVSGFDGVAVSLYDMMTALDQASSTLSDSQLTRLQQFCSDWKDAMLNWKLSNLNGA